MGDIWLKTLVELGVEQKDAEAKLEIFRTKLNEHFGEQRGGGDSLLNTVGGKFIDFVSTSQGVAIFLSTLPKFLFILKTVEKIPALGVLIGVVLDAMLTGLSTGGEMFQNLVVLVPGAGPAIVAIFGIFFWPPVAMIAFSRADFSEATEIYLKAIPFGIGKILSTAFAKTDKFATKIADRLGLIKAQVTGIVDKLKSTLSNAKSVVEEKAQGVVTGIKDKASALGTKALDTLGSKAEELTGRLVGKFKDKFGDAKEALKGKASNLMNGLRDKAENTLGSKADGMKDRLLGNLKDNLGDTKASNLMDGLRDKAENTLGSKADGMKDRLLGNLKDKLGDTKASNLMDGLRDKAENTLGSKIDDVPNVRKAFAPMRVRKRGGGKRLSTKKRGKNNKWRKTRRTKKF